MGEENGLPTVEESTEPPLCAQHNGHNNGTPITASQHTRGEPLSHDEGFPVPPAAAHTLSAEAVASELGVDIRYDLT